MDDLLWPRVLATFGVDASLAVLCGLLLAGLWLGNMARSRADVLDRKAVGLRLFSAMLLVCLCGQLVLLAISFRGEDSVRVVMTSMPDVCSTHAGALLLALCGVAAGLCFAAWIPSRQARTTICGLLLLGALGLHAGTGHAAGDGNFSLAELLQAIHLLGMAVWSGGVIVSGLFIVPRLQDLASGQIVLAPRSPAASYLDRLSLASTWAVGAVVLSGLVKAYLATGASVQVIRSSEWGQILTAKTACVTVAFLLGARNRGLLATGRRQAPSFVRSVTWTLRLEAITMLGVLLLSAWLASSQPPLD